jgi:sulfoxide reductase heme-binding subunit YedZ
VRHHLPLALASCAVLALFMTVPRFDANRYPHADLTSGVFPKERERGMGSMKEALQRPSGHGSRDTRSNDESGGHGGAMPSGMNHGQGGSTSHGGVQPTSMGHGESRSRRTGSNAVPGFSFLGLNNRRFTVATGYLAAGLLALTLLIGPANLLLRRRNPVSSYLRRDVGAWTAVFSAVHVLYGLQVHRKLSEFLDYFLATDGHPLTNSFGLGNWTGLAALLIVLGLLALSSNAALRKLKARNWKRLQRLNYALFVLVVAHAFFYGAFVRSSSPYTLLLILSAITVFGAQTIGAMLYRRRHASKAAGLG